MSLGGKYVFATVMCLVLPMCISCSSVLCVLMVLGMFVKVMSSLISVMSPLLVCVLSVCAYCGVVGYFSCVSFVSCIVMNRSPIFGGRGCVETTCADVYSIPTSCRLCLFGTPVPLLTSSG